MKLTKQKIQEIEDILNERVNAWLSAGGREQDRFIHLTISEIADTIEPDDWGSGYETV